MKHPQGKKNILSSAIKALIIPLVDTLFSYVERYLFSLKQVVHVGANNSPLLLFLPKVEMPDRLLSSPCHPLQVARQDSYFHPEQLAHQECLVDSCWHIFLSRTCVPLVVHLILEVWLFVKRSPLLTCSPLGVPLTL